MPLRGRIASMLYIYEAVYRGKDEIATNWKNQQSRYNKVWKIIDTHWDLQLHNNLHVASLYLNPSYAISI